MFVADDGRDRKYSSRLPACLFAIRLPVGVCPLSNRVLNTESSGPAPDGVTTCRINYLDLILHFYGHSQPNHTHTHKHTDKWENA